MSRKRGRDEKGKSKPKKGPKIEYDGYVVSKGDVIEQVDFGSTTGETFFDRFIAARRPCVVNGFNPGVDLSVTGLLKKAANEIVEVEQPPFGSGNKKEMLFKDFCSNLTQGYMTTQKGQADVVSSPLQAVGIPLKLPLSGNLAIANVSVVLGFDDCVALSWSGLFILFYH